MPSLKFTIVNSFEKHKFNRMKLDLPNVNTKLDFHNVKTTQFGKLHNLLEHKGECNKHILYSKLA